MKNYLDVINRLADFMLKNDGDPPNMVKSFNTDNRYSLAAYHVFEDDPAHIRNGGATTSEGQELFFNFMTLYAAVTGDVTPMAGAYNYIHLYMMPHDGIDSEKLPCNLLELSNIAYNPYMVQWLVDISGNAKTGDAIFGENTAYKIYEKAPYACVVNTKSCSKKDIVTGAKCSLIKDSSFRFACATDADQWIQNGFYWAGKYGLANYSDDIKKFEKSLKMVLSPKDSKYPDVMMFGYMWGGNAQEKWGWNEIVSDLYTGYQDPAAWHIMGCDDVATNTVMFLLDAQREYFKRYGIEGLFMPLFVEGEWTWSGSDPNTHWMGFQYRTFAHLAHYYYLTGDCNSKKILDKFFYYIEENLNSEDGKLLIPSALYSGAVDGEGCVHDKGELGSIESLGYYPDCHGLYAQGLVFLAAKSKDRKVMLATEKILDDLKLRQSDNGSFGFDGKTYGFHQSEIGIAFCLYQLLISGK